MVLLRNENDELVIVFDKYEIWPERNDDYGNEKRRSMMLRLGTGCGTNPFAENKKSEQENLL